MHVQHDLNNGKCGVSERWIRAIICYLPSKLIINIFCSFVGIIGLIQLQENMSWVRESLLKIILKVAK
jgi:hypothetical protein